MTRIYFRKQAWFCVAPVIAALVFFICLPLYLSAQEDPPLEPPSKELADAAFDLEAKAREFEGKGLYSEAVDIYRQALLKAVELASGEQGEQASRYWAEAEVYLDRTVSLMHQKPMPDYAEIRDFLAGFQKDHELAPVMKGWLQWQLSNAFQRTGEIEKIRQTIREMGFVTDWMIIGPFQNERGGGFDVPYGPEIETDFDAAYAGKKRKVRWRRLPVKPLFGEVNFDAMMRPNDEVLAYAQTFVEVEEASDAALRIGSDEGSKIWVNDILVLDSDIHRTMGFDQDAVGVRLGKGRNKILVKVAERNGGWGFRLRITKPDGGALKFVTNAKPEDMTFAKMEKMPEVEVQRGAIGYYEKRTEAAPEDVMAQAHFGYLQLVHSFEDENVHKDRAAFEQCVKLAPENPYYQFMLAEAYQMHEAKMDAEKEGNKSRLAVEKAIELEPEYVEALVNMGRYYLTEMKNWHKAKGYIDRALKVNPDYLHALLLGIDILDARQFGTEVTIKTKELESHKLDEIKNSPSILQRLVEIYDDESRPQKVMETLSAVIRRDYVSGWARGKLVDHYGRLGERDKVLEQYQLLRELYPYELSYLSLSAAIYEGRDEFEKALAQVEMALEICPEAEDEMVKKGNLLMRLSLEKGEDTSGEIYAKAMEVYEAVRRINPNNVWLKRYIEFLHEEKKSFEENPRLAAEVEVKADDGVYVKYKRLVTADDGSEKLEDVVEHFANKELTALADEENLPFVCILSKQAMDVRKDGTSSEFTHFVVKVFNDVGTERFRYFPAGYFMTSYNQEVKIKKARIIHEDGTEEEGRSMGYAAVFPKLKPGDIVDVQFRVDDQMSDLTERFFGDYFGHVHFFHNTFYFGDMVPIMLSEYYLILPKERKFYFNHLNTEARPVKEPGLSEKTEMYVWRLKDLPHLVPEILMPPHEQFLPALQVSSFGDWNEFGKWFFNLVKKQYDVSPEMKEKIQELVKDKETELDKIRAIYNFVVTDISYQAWEYGIHGWQPYKASTIFARKFGDCKDKALLINTMLKEIGIKSIPVLIEGTNTRGKHDMTLPMVRHFNHCIAYAPPSGGRENGLWMDGTAEFYGLTDGPPFMDWGARVLVVDEEGGKLLDVPLPDPKESVQTESTVVEIRPDGSAKVKSKFTVDGDNAAEVRRRFSVEGKREILLGDLYGQRFAGAKVLSSEFPDLTNLNAKSLTYGYELEIPDFVKKTPEGLALTHEMFAVPWSTLTPQAERKHEMVLPYVLGIPPVALTLPGTLRKETTFVLPKDFKLLSLPKNESFSSEFADFELTFEKEDGERPKVFANRKITFKKNNLSVKEYGKLRDLTSLLEKIQKEMPIIKGPEAPEPPPEKEGEEKPSEENGEAKPSEEQGK